MRPYRSALAAFERQSETGVFGEVRSPFHALKDAGLYPDVADAGVVALDEGPTPATCGLRGAGEAGVRAVGGGVPRIPTPGTVRLTVEAA